MQTAQTFKNRLTGLFAQQKSGLLNIYFTAGFPKVDDTVSIIKALEKAGVDMIEIGIPFSDPLADGPTIQMSSEAALKNGMSIKLLFDQMKDIRKEVRVPLLLMGYLNPVLQFGIEKFCRQAADTGIDGLIIPDLPVNEYNELYRDLFESCNLSNVFLVTPHTSPERLKLIDESSKGFIYAVSTDSTTGNTRDITRGQEEYFLRLKETKLNNPVMIGFNIHDNASFSYACRFASGGIIGSAFIKAIRESKELEKDIKLFVEKVRG